MSTCEALHRIDMVRRSQGGPPPRPPRAPPACGNVTGRPQRQRLQEGAQQRVQEGGYRRRVRLVREEGRDVSG
jgi:hypothetical protein